MEILFYDNLIKIKNLICFNLALTLDCGQAFRWKRDESGCWSGVAFGKYIKIYQKDDEVCILGATREDFQNVWFSYFDLERDYEKLCECFCEDESMKEAVAAYPGIRILRQEPWEALCSFIISQNNNIPRIKGIIERLCRGFGERLRCGEYAFPTAQRLSELSVEELAPIRAGFRAKYILDAAKKVSCGEIRLDLLPSLPIEQARQELLRIKGVGAKVAECTLLYGCGRTEAFPEDVWVKRVMAELYPQGLPACMIENQGIAQQYLFHWRRNRKSTKIFNIYII
jgi:N-glycosylase/DNA lyase